MNIKTSNAALGSFAFLVLTAIFIILHNLVSSLTNTDEQFFFSLVFIFFLGFCIFMTIFIIKLFSRFYKPKPLEYIQDEAPTQTQTQA